MFVFCSKFILPGSKRVQTQGSNLKDVQISSFLQRDNSVVVVILNK